MTTLTQHQTVLHWYETANQDWERPGPAIGQPQRFYTEPPVDYAISAGTVIQIDYDTWQDMGAPIDITVTVTPGDTLNDKDQ